MAYKIKAGYSVVSGKTHRVVARTKKLTTARKRAEGLVRRGSKRVSIMRGGKLIATMGSFGAPKRRRRRATAGRRTSRAAARRTSRRHSSKRRSSKRRSSRRRVSKNRRHRRSSRRRSSHRRSSRRRSSRR